MCLSCSLLTISLVVRVPPQASPSTFPRSSEDGSRPGEQLLPRPGHDMFYAYAKVCIGLCSIAELQCLRTLHSLAAPTHHPTAVHLRHKERAHQSDAAVSAGAHVWLPKKQQTHRSAVLLVRLRPVLARLGYPLLFADILLYCCAQPSTLGKSPHKVHSYPI